CYACNAGGCHQHNLTCFNGCKIGFYRHDCNAACGHCDGDESCHRTTGVCKFGCKPGFKGSLCTDILDSEAKDDLQSYSIIGYIVAGALAGMMVLYFIFCQSPDNKRGVDRAYEATAPKFAIDFNKDTCNRDRSSRAIVFLFNTEIRFFFMEIDFAHFSSVPMSLLKFSVRINFNDNAEDTRESMKILEKTPHKVQYYCDSKISFTKLTLHGRGISHICSVYVSGGRNFAAFNKNISINQTNTVAEVSQTRINGDILHSVDNDISTCFHADNQNSWEINFHIHFLLSRIIIHNYKGNIRCSKATITPKRPEAKRPP
uniref:EGF-like domain-containing protein n=1 Tax=Biomphalaria glabrata TaxID=6526 RepID=A0A2C9KK77_BIOGL